MFTSTLFVLATLAPDLKYGDLIFFFEFCDVELLDKPHHSEPMELSQ